MNVKGLSDAERDEVINKLKNVLHPLDAADAEGLALVLGFHVSQEVCKMRGFKTQEEYKTHVLEAFDIWLEDNPYLLGVKH